MAGNTTTREISWRDLVLRANPEHTRESRYVIEYEFTAPSKRVGDERTHEGARRVFRGNYDVRGPYTPEVASSSGLTWGTITINWGDEELTWE